MRELSSAPWLERSALNHTALPWYQIQDVVTKRIHSDFPLCAHGRHRTAQLPKDM